MSLETFYFDGQTSQRHTACLEVRQGKLFFRGPEGECEYALDAVQISEPQGAAPRTLRLPDGGTCEVAQGEALTALLGELGHRESLTVRMQKRWGWSLLALVLVAFTMFSGYHWGLPRFAEATAPMLPADSLASLSKAALRQMEKKGDLLPSQLSYGRKQKLSSEFMQMVSLDPELAYYGTNLSLLFYRAPSIGPNAFAFPGGQIVLLDELVDFAGSDEEVLAVLAHELGHASRRHGARQLIQTSILSAFAAAYFGDVSQIAAIVTTVVLNASYSRNMEREADDYAARILIRQNKSPLHLANALERLERSFRKRNGQKDEEDESGSWLDSHPGTRERIAYLRSIPLPATLEKVPPLEEEAEEDEEEDYGEAE
ncbi:MAG: M48 family metallopeptidase [Zoogloeaceae bacterium]|jgi:Zn-dependent protease with chaperone function|nr:M48 family metallopeptidase [Zoogloeaceae bacterium]